ncbi:MAG: hypothetical protein NTV51_13800 [Verrucomicrobia bacterium]|nr:hypothetical protein [Verrucomicrobiota bacterium]
MKPTTLLLAASLVANVALVALVATHSADPAPASSAAIGTASGKPSGSASASSDALRAALASGDTAALTAAGLPADVARDLSLGRAFARYQQKISAARTAGAGGDNRWWRNRTSAPRTREEELLARRELSDALMAAFGDDLGLSGADATQFAFLSPEKRNALRRITQDYDEMMAKFSAGGVQLASDKEKLRLLRAERDRDIAALLTPAELADYELRTSPSAATVRARYGDALASEDDFKKLYALQKAYDEKFPADALTGRVTPETLRARTDAQAQLQSDIRAALGEDKYAAVRRAADPELRTLDSLVSRVGLPATTTDRVATSRETYAAESQRINSDTSLSPTERRAQLQALGTKAKSELATTLGAEVADAYSPRASWLNMLQSGIAFSTTPTASSPGGLSLSGATQSVYPVMPAGTTAAGGPRQVVNFVSSTTDSTNAPVGGALFSGGSSGEPTNRTMQVISVGSTTTAGPNHHDATTTTTVAPAATPPK